MITTGSQGPRRGPAQAERSGIAALKCRSGEGNASADLERVGFWVASVGVCR